VAGGDDHLAEGGDSFYSGDGFEEGGGLVAAEGAEECDAFGEILDGGLCGVVPE
jgi:hypothetical protein